MAIVSISRGSNSRGAEVAEKAARRLGYRCLAREAVFEAAGLYNIPEAELAQAIDRPPSLLERSVDSKAHYIATIRAALLHRFSEDNVVYHGFAGHYFVRDIPHALKVRILAELSDRVAAIVERDRVPPQQARLQLLKMDKARRQWGLHLYGLDPEDPSLYDIVLHVGKMGTDGAAEVICELVTYDAFRTTERSRAELSNLSLAASVRAAITDLELDLTILDVAANDGVVRISFHEASFTRASPSSGFREHYLECMEQRVNERTHTIPGLREIKLKHRDE
jgi:cytidylate kinase